ncbi:hypothetical protein [Tunturiibacter gelidoferens]|uniref:Uncharacterized protein n=1 Tax=Tunturiibacter gelidiferens TaxID=3069689 RepID=A0ACC5P2V1_9BACT|nr:hypothetical protein [Edaphobacter lichenicola]MBB5340923.1 hypothetical protein [Edaphobacter lichenicola]
MAQTDPLQAPDAEAKLSWPDAPALPESPAASTSGAPVGESSLAGEPTGSAGNFIPDPEEHLSLPTRRDMTILPAETAHPLTSHEKVLLGLKESVSLFSIVGWSASAGYSHLINSSPNYGTDKAAFGERLGSAALRSVTDNLFSVALFAPLLHEDPRYYELGAGHSFFKRFLHGVERPLITKSDDGRPTANFSLIAGNLVGSALTNAYYPERNRSAGQTTVTFGASMGGSALGYVVNEFLNDALAAAHIRKVD